MITVGKNPPANAGDTGLIPGSRRFHVAEKLNLYPTVTEPLGSRSLSSATREPPQWEAGTPKPRAAPLSTTSKSEHAAVRMQGNQINHLKKKANGWLPKGKGGGRDKLGVWD